MILVYVVDLNAEGASFVVEEIEPNREARDHGVNEARRRDAGDQLNGRLPVAVWTLLLPALAEVDIEPEPAQSSDGDVNRPGADQATLMLYPARDRLGRVSDANGRSVSAASCGGGDACVDPDVVACARIDTRQVARRWDEQKVSRKILEV